MEKIYLTKGQEPESQMGAALESLAHTIHERHLAADPQSYTYRLLSGNLDDLLKKLVEEAHETTLAAKDLSAKDADPREVDHLRYEAGDVVYHLLVLLERCGIDLDEFAAEMNTRMTDDEIALRTGVVMLKPDFVNRGSNH
jgi:phosphoribosyl-ATP pyrophosphohydrolase/phosphoribosyl-ATP pyrophosphohydrolase/phosphoribosyl-AMP cyclohydrolase